MGTSEKKMGSLSRRSFLAAASAAAATLGLSGGGLVGCSGAGQTSTGSDEQTKEDRWIPTSCNMCFNCCSIKAHVVDGVVVELAGDENSTMRGHICGKGAAGIMQLYDPYRITKPMKRTNPEKGIDIDPGWEEITWDEAYEIAAQKISETVAERPQNFITAFVVASSAAASSLIGFAGAGYGSYEFMMSDICGSGIHQYSDLYTSTGHSGPDYVYTKYLIHFGTQAGIATRHGLNTVAELWAEARDNGAKLVVFDPHMSHSAEKADMWIPIRPGTDTAAALALANVLVHELDLLDYDYLVNRTNGPALLNKETMRVVYDETTGKSLYMDKADSTAKPYDKCSEPVLEGEFEVNGMQVITAWSAYKNHIEQYTPEWQEPITTVPAATIRQVAREFGEAACIGQTITIDGVELPYRPACTDLFSGISRHKHVGQAAMAIWDLNILVGSMNQCGGFLTYAPACHGFADGNDNVNWGLEIWEPDGLIDSHMMGSNANHSRYAKAYADDYSPTEGGFMSLSPMMNDPHFKFISQNKPELFNNAWEPSKVAFVFASNPVRWWQNHDEQIELWKSFEYLIDCDIYLTDFAPLCDLIMPEACYLERLEPLPLAYYGYKGVGSMEIPWMLSIRQPVVPARDGCPSGQEIFAELVDRGGSNENYWQYMLANMVVDEKYSSELDTSKKFDIEAYYDAVMKTAVDEEHGLEWFKEHGVYTYPRKVEDQYFWAHGEPGRIPIYCDLVLEAKDRAKSEIEKLGGFKFDWEFEEYTAMPEWMPCCDHEVEDPDYDMFPVYWADAINMDTYTPYNAWINELNEMNPLGYAIEMNAATAAAKGLASGDEVILTSREGVTVEGKLVVSETVHPEVISVLVGSWNSRSDDIPIAKGKGVAITHLIPGQDPKRFDHLTAAIDQCIRVKISKK